MSRACRSVNEEKKKSCLRNENEADLHVELEEKFFFFLARKLSESGRYLT